MAAPRATFSLGGASRRWWAVLFALLAGSVYAYRTRVAVVPAADTRFSGFAQGSTYSVVLGKAVSRPRRIALQHAVDSVLQEIDHSMSTYDSTSEISRLNRGALRVPVTVSAPLADVLAEAAVVSQASDGAFDVTVGPLARAWGFGPAGTLERVPTPTELAALRGRVGWGALQIDGRTITKQRAGLEIDLNGIAPGYSVDRISALLTAVGVPDHFVELGGEVRARGRNGGGRPFRVGIEEPDTIGRRVRLAVMLTDKALSTSGNYRNAVTIDGVRYVHTIDPHSGRPVTHRLLAVSVLHERCAMADAWATALLVVGPEMAWTLAQANGLDVLLLVAGPDGQVLERMTSGFSSIVDRVPFAARSSEVH